ncbi:MAG: aspartyl-phosphate phosphatase Spo0E family protein [Bacillota bacterium]
MADSVFALVLRKEILRGQLEDKATKLGMGHPEVVKINRKLDRVVVSLQRRMVG